MLPLWLAKSLADRRHVEIMLPKHYGANYRNALKANEGQDLTAQQDLSHSSDFYFDVGMQLSQMYVDLVPSPLSRASNMLHSLLGVKQAEVVRRQLAVQS